MAWTSGLTDFFGYTNWILKMGGGGSAPTAGVAVRIDRR